MKNIFNLSIPIFAAAILIFFGATRIMHYFGYRNLEFQGNRLKQEIELGDNLADHDKAVNHFKKMTPPIPEIELRILQHQWEISLEILKQIQIAKYNALLEKDVTFLYKKLSDILAEMKDRCDSVLNESKPPNVDITWRVLNIRGSIKILSSFIILETEGNWKKVTGTMKEAILDLRSAVDTADQACPTTFEKNIPRWNLELLQGQDFVKKIKLTKMEAEQRLELRDNLEAIIPEKGGYAPGEPLDRKIRK